MDSFHGTTILSVRRGDSVALGGDGQVTLGNVVIKSTARKVRRLYHERVLAGFAGGDGRRVHAVRALRGQARQAPGPPDRARRSNSPRTGARDRILRRLEAMLAVADRTRLADHHRQRRRARARARHRRHRLAAARTRRRRRARCSSNTELDAAEIVKQALTIAGDLCIYTNQNHVIEVLQPLPGAEGTPMSSPADHAGAGSGGARHYDVLIAGAGLVGLALAPALARSGLDVVLADRAVARGARGRAGQLGRSRLRDQPGSAALLHSIGAWQALPPERIAAVESMRVAGDAARNSLLGLGPGERALAWIVEERALRAALVPRSVPPASNLRARHLHGLTGLPMARLTSPRGGRLTARLVVAADGLRSWSVAQRASTRRRGPTARRRRRQFRLRARASRRRAAMVPDDGSILAWLPLPGRRMSIVWSAPEARRGFARPRRRPSLRSASLTPAPHARRLAPPHPGGRLSAAAHEAAGDHRAPAGAGRRRRARRAPARRPGRQPGLRRRRGAGDGPRQRGPVRMPAPRSCSSATAGDVPSRCWRCRASPTGSPASSAVRAPWQKTLRNLGMAAVERLPLVETRAGAIRPALTALPTRRSPMHFSNLIRGAVAATLAGVLLAAPAAFAQSAPKAAAKPAAKSAPAPAASDAGVAAITKLWSRTSPAPPSAMSRGRPTSGSTRRRSTSN